MSFTADMYGDTQFPASSFVPPEGPLDARIMVIGEAPGKSEDKGELQEDGTIIYRPFVGAAGKTLNQLMKQAGIARENVWLTNVIKRRPPGNKINSKDAMKEIDQSIPGLWKEIHRVKPTVIVPLGNTAMHAIGLTHSITAARGFVIPTEIGKVIPSFHPAYIFRQFHEKVTCQRDWQKIARHANKQGTPTFPEDFELNPSIEDVERFTYLIECKVESGQKVEIAFDLETFYFDGTPLNTPIKLVGMALTESKAMCIPFIDQQGHYYWKSEDEQIRAIQCIQRIMSNPNITLLIHNGLFDVLVMMNHGFNIQCKIYDTMLAQTMVYHMSKHDLGYLASIYTDFPPWKLDVGHTDKDFRYYNVQDCTALKYIMPHLREDVQSNRVGFLVDTLMRTIIPTCRMMLKGIAIDRDQYTIVKERLEKDIGEIKEKLCRIAGDPAFNPNADSQVRDLLFTKLKLKSAVKTKKSKKLSVAKDVLNRLELRYPGNEAVSTLQEYNHFNQQYSNFISDLPIFIDERVHSSFKLHRVVTGRYSSTDPNIMNLPNTQDKEGYIRGMYRVAPGRMIVTADYSQLELMIFAELAQDEIWLDAFRRGIDVHELNGDALLGKYDPQYRTFIKNFIYGLIYGSEGGEVEKVAPKELIQRISVRQMMGNLQDTHPWMFTYRKQIEDQVRKTQHVTNAFGRKRWFTNRTLTKAELRAAYNHPIQGTAADIMHTRTPLIDEALDHERDWLVLQLHDAFYIETDERRVDTIANILKTTMESPIETPTGHQFNLRADVDYGRSLAKKDLTAWQK